MMLCLSVRVLEDVQTCGGRTHQAIFDSVVNHLHEMPRARGATVQIAFFGGPVNLLAPGSARSVAATRSKRLENGIKVPHGVVFAANHLAIAALEPPDAAARADVNVVNAFYRKLLWPPDVIHVIQISPVDTHVPRFKLRNEVVQS